jgi:hypothetical protein
MGGKEEAERVLAAKFAAIFPHLDEAAAAAADGR